MSEKARDPKGRWRSVSVSFRVSPEEIAQIDAMVRLSGLTKQEYLARRVTQKDVIVQPNPRVYKALKIQLDNIHEELHRLADVAESNEELGELLQIIIKMCDDLKRK